MQIMKRIISCQRVNNIFARTSRRLHYVQGQRNSASIREYFYYIDHRGKLFLDDAKIKNFTSCFKEKQFLQFFFSRLKINDKKERYSEAFPFVSPCGVELNFVRCDDLPVVFDKIVTVDEWLTGKNSLPEIKPMTSHVLTYAKGQLGHAFSPAELLVESESGRLYHPAPDRVGAVGLVASMLAESFSEHFHNDGELKLEEVG